MPQFTLDDLSNIIKERSAAMAKSSYTKLLLDSGVERVAKKFGEESVEVVIAAVQKDRDALIAESADVLYHLLVLFQASDISLDQVLGELQRRTAQSGLAEKAGRKD